MQELQPNTPLSLSHSNKILVWISRFDEHKLFWPHFCGWYAEQKVRYGVDIQFDCTYRKPLHKAQQTAVARAISGGFTHLLFIEDDHWGFPVDGLEVLLRADEWIIALHTYGRGNPMYSLTLDKTNPDLSLLDEDQMLRPVEWIKGTPLIQERDLVNFGFCLIKTELFLMLESDPFSYWGEKGTDCQLCQAAADIGIRPKAYYGYTLPHDDVPPELRMQYQRLFYTQAKMKRGDVWQNQSLIQVEDETV